VWRQATALYTPPRSLDIPAIQPAASVSAGPTKDVTEELTDHCWINKCMMFAACWFVRCVSFVAFLVICGSYARAICLL